jgi:precorrin-2 dehydrogenase / sirohydrochlorin ferrochelatase
VDKRFYMAALDVTGRRCLVVGGGPVALEKATGLVACDAIVEVVAPELNDGFSCLPVEWRSGHYRTEDLDGCFLVIAATSDRSVNERVHADAEARGMLCNVADVPELCNFILPAVHREGPIAVAVSTGGASPALAKRLRSQIAELIQPGHAELARELEALRPEAKKRFKTYEERRDYFEEIVESRLS